MSPKYPSHNLNVIDSSTSQLLQGCVGLYRQWPRPKTTEIRDYVILQQPDHLDEAENFAQLKEFVLASPEETPTYNAQKLLAQAIEELSETTRSEDKTLGAFNSQRNDFDDCGVM